MGKRKLLGYSDNPDPALVARHETGHLLMLWLLDRNAIACGATKGFGVTQQLNTPDAPLENQFEHILYALAGMVAEMNEFLINELRANIATPERFHPRSDSYHVALAISLLKGDPAALLENYLELSRRLLLRYYREVNQVLRLLRKQDILSFDILHGLFQKWDARHFADGRAKSDVVVRTAARIFRWRLVKKTQYGWDLKPLPENWKPVTRPTLIELARMVKGDLDRMKKEYEEIK